MGSLSRPSGVGAFEYQPAVSTTPNVHPEFPYVSPISDWSAQIMVSDRVVPLAAPLGPPPSL